MPSFEHQTLHLHFEDLGTGLPFFFQHGLGADVGQPLGLFRPPPGVRLICMDCRGHGRSSLGHPDQIRLGTFADDLIALMDHLALPAGVVGGISMGAAVSLNLALRFPSRVVGLVLSRPAWLDAPNPATAKLFSWIAGLIKKHGPEEGCRVFKQSSEYRAMRDEYPDTARSLEGQFSKARALESCVTLERIPKDRPNSTRDDWRRIPVPTLVLANRKDPIHPFEFGEILAAHITGAEFRELVSKSVDGALHQEQVQSYLEGFLTSHFLNVPTR